MKRRRYYNVTSFLDRHGVERWRWRKTGFRQHCFKAPYGSAEFDAEYAACRNQTLPVGASRTVPGSIDELVSRYLGSPKFLSIPGEGTRHSNRLILERFRAEHGKKPVALIEATHIETILLKATRKRKEGKRWVGGPEGARKLRKELRKLFKYAVKSKMIAANPVDLADALPVSRSKGFHAWTESEIAQFQKRHPLGTKARLALEIMLWTAQRMGDAHLFGPAHLKSGKVNYVQEKTGKELWLPTSPQLLAAIKAMPAVGVTTYIVTEAGRPFSRKGFNNKMRQWCSEAGLPHCQSHGLRKAIGRRLAEGGATQQQIKAVGGWSKDEQVRTYTEAADQARLAEQGFALIGEKE